MLSLMESVLPDAVTACEAEPIKLTAAGIHTIVYADSVQSAAEDCDACSVTDAVVSLTVVLWIVLTDRFEPPAAVPAFPPGNE
jgi:hypothetical protein